jgi:DEAD/DEAH box helicase domain-containing protein
MVMQEALIPSTLSHHLKENVVSYLKTTFNIKNQGFVDRLETHIRGDNGIFRGPYVDIKLPFRSSKILPTSLTDLKLQFNPFEHQMKAFERLSTKNHSPENTLVVTGTGSGKTECFLMPILDHCLRQRKSNVPGIKALILYPMNALAFDQARRIAGMIASYPELNNQITAGILVGEDRDADEKRTTHKVMSFEHIVDDRPTILKTPPDILLTNYKMLDLLLMKPEFARLWAGAIGDQSSLQFLVLDEMHTYDGAQGSDVSLLIRRLKEKLQIPPRRLTCIGTSATLLSGLEGSSVLCRFASRLFGEQFESTAIVKESRESVEEVFDGISIDFNKIPKDDRVLEFNGDLSLAEYINKQASLWFGITAEDSSLLGQRIKGHKLTREILRALAGKPQTEEDLLKVITITARQLHSYLGLLAHSTKDVPFGETKIKAPLFFVRVQLWLRELRRLLSTLDYDNPEFRWLEEKTISKQTRHLPPVFCEECGEHGFLVSIDRHQEFEWDIQAIYERYAKADGHVRYLFPWRELTSNDQQEMEELLRNKIKICPECGLYEYESPGEKQHQKCPTCGAGWKVFRKWECLSEERQRDKRQCPSCDSRDSLRLLASRTTTLTSVINSQLFLSKLNPYNSKKLLVFADSVQDASHRAGYYNARTFRFNFRTAIQSYLTTLDSDPTLTALAEPFLDYWKKELGEEKAAATFCPSDLAGSDIYEEFFESKKKAPLWALLQPRTTWELYLEYSLRSQVGRTLEKTLSSAGYLPVKMLLEKSDAAYAKLSNDYEIVRQCSQERFRHFILGIFERALVRGCVAFEFLDDYRHKESAWELDKKKPGLEWISRMPKGRLDGSEIGALPKFISFDSSAKIFDFAGTLDRGENWFSFWFKKTFLTENIETYRRSDITPFYKSLFLILEAEGLLSFITNRSGVKNFGIQPNLIKISRDVISLECDSCAHKTVVPRAEVKSYLGMGCVITHCKGAFSKEKDSRNSYYRDIYESGDIERIFSKEHTGLLSRKRREALETEFKEVDAAKRRADAVNLLSCTPTLEMGIDIGDLSATVVGALPASASSYQQQIGRAGRKSGSALVVSIAQSRPRDLLYFRYPEELIAGNIEPPGCFLDAPDILKRQFFAYLFDQSFSELAKGVEKLSVTNLRKEVRETTQTGFLKNLQAILIGSADNRLKQFRARFQESEVSDDTWQELSSEFGPKTGQVAFVTRIKKIIENFDNDVNSLDHTERDLKEKLKPFEDGESAGVKLNDDKSQEFRDLKRERATVEAQKQLLGTRDGFFEFLTHYGLLPNYAFQEDTVELVGLILDESKEKGKKVGIRHRESFDRPAKIALRELAPQNTFYGGGYKMQIDQLDVGGKAHSLIEDWRVCRACGFLSRENKENQVKGCPRCSDLQWNDRGSHTQMLKLHRAIAFDDAHSSQIGDEAEDRQKKFFKVRSFFDFPKSCVREAWACTSEDFVFGIEFLSRITLREVNFGSDEYVSEKIEISGEELPRGFRVCHDCGRVAEQRGGKEEIKHLRTCRHSKATTSTQATRLPDPIMLYRELQSEAIRVLLPVSEYDADVRTSSIRAALMLGFIKKFGGKPVHLEIGQQRVIEAGEEKLSKRYLVIFDSVPGGTGFLRELWNKDSFFEMIEISLKVMKDCTCSTARDLDGCPRCILAGAGQYDLPNVSRNEAIKYLEAILNHKDQMSALQTGLDSVHVEGFLDSDLEYRFLAILRNLGESGNRIKLERYGIELVEIIKTNDEKKPLEIKLKKKGADQIYHYRIGHQKPLNKGIKHTIADFYFERLDIDNAKPTAVFLDGFKYHAGPQSGDRLAADFVKREALVNGDGVPKHQVWTMTWKDIETFEREASEHPARYFDIECNDQGNFLGQNPVVQFLHVLVGERPEKSFMGLIMNAAKIQKLSASQCSNLAVKGLTEIENVSSLGADIASAISKNPGQDYLIFKSASAPNGQLLITKMGGNRLVSGLHFTSPLAGREQPMFYESWERLLCTFNILQLLSDEMIIRVWAET